MAKVKVLPVVAIDGRYYDCDDATVPLDGIQVRWGRSGLLAKPQPATAEIRLFDTTDDWKTRFTIGTVTDTVIGLPVSLQANLYLDDSDTIHKSWTWFRGNITNVSITDGPTDPATNRVIGRVVTIEATDPTAILGEVLNPSAYIPDAAWAQDETLLTRANYLRNDALPFAGISEMFFKPTKQDFWCSSVTLTDKTVGSLVDEFYTSQAAVACYSPKDNCIRDGQQFNGTTLTSWYRFTDGYIHIAPNENPRIGAYGTDTDRYYGTSISGAKVSESGGDVSRSAEQGINTWTVRYWSRERNQDWHRTLMYAGTEYHPRKSWELSTWLENDVDVQVIVDEMDTMIHRPLRAPTHPSVNFNTGNNNSGFESVVQAMNLVMAGERQFLLYVSGSPWTEYTSLTPMFGVVGGVIRLENQQWDIDLQLQHYSTDYPAYDNAKWSTLPSSLDWGDIPECDDKLEHGISWWDTRFVHQAATIRTNADD